MKKQAVPRSRKIGEPTIKSFRAGLLPHGRTGHGGHGLIAQHRERAIRLTSLAPPLVRTEVKAKPPTDRYEREANLVSEHVMGIGNPSLRRQADKGTGPSVSRAQPVLGEMTPRVPKQRHGQEESFQTKTGSGRMADANTVPASSLGSVLVGGQSLDSTTRDFFEPRFGHDFSQVRIHTDADADRSARSVNALAYTVGNHIVFRSGYFNAVSEQGKRLLSHELVHTIQQGAVAVGSNNTFTSLQRMPDEVDKDEKDKTVSCDTLQNDPKDFAYQVAKHYVRTELSQKDLTPKSFTCPRERLCMVYFKDKTGVKVDWQVAGRPFCDIFDGKPCVRAQRILPSLGVECEYYYHCRSNGGLKLALEKRSCTNP